LGSGLREDGFHKGDLLFLRALFSESVNSKSLIPSLIPENLGPLIGSPFIYNFQIFKGN
jgi:hypothetical protein